MTLLERLEESVAAMATGPEHAALVELARSLAECIDGLGDFDDKAYREYRMVLKDLREACSGGGVDELSQALDELRASMGDGEDAGQENDRPKAGGRGRAAGNPSDALAAPYSGRRRRAGER